MACQTWCRASVQQGSHPCKNSHPQPRLDFGPGWSTTVLGCRRVPCRKAEGTVGECLNRQKSQLGSSRFYWEDGNVCVAVGRRNPPRL
eukprot:scaffold528_cov126-Isochrysis_galbana.AAC.8